MEEISLPRLFELIKHPRNQEILALKSLAVKKFKPGAFPFFSWKTRDLITWQIKESQFGEYFRLNRYKSFFSILRNINV